MKNMAYTTNPHLPKVRRDAVNLVKYRHWSMRKVALKYGVEPSTISRWCRHPLGTGWHEIPTRKSTPKSNPQALSKEIVSAIIEKIRQRRRCGQVVHHELLRDGVKVSLSSVQRTLERCHLLKKRSPWKRPHDFTERPEAAFAGALVQLDTIHILAPDGSRIYVYTLIDLFSRWAYAEVVEKIGAKPSVGFVRRAKRSASFKFVMIQTDNGAEFSQGFTHGLLTQGIAHRHSRVRKSNDNAHVERFNRSIQEECLDQTVHTVSSFKKAIISYLNYYNHERLHMGINYQTPMEVLRRS
jgi:transposase InsO family protein